MLKIDLLHNTVCEWHFFVIYRTSLLTGREALVCAGGHVPTGAVGLHGNRVVGATGDAAHQAVWVLRVAASVTAGGGQRGDERVGSFSLGPCDVCHCLSDLIYCDVHRAAGLCGTKKHDGSSGWYLWHLISTNMKNPECKIAFVFLFFKYRATLVIWFKYICLGAKVFYKKKS